MILIQFNGNEEYTRLTDALVKPFKMTDIVAIAYTIKGEKKEARKLFDSLKLNTETVEFKRVTLGKGGFGKEPFDSDSKLSHFPESVRDEISGLTATIRGALDAINEIAPEHGYDLNVYWRTLKKETEEAVEEVSTAEAVN